MGRVNDTAYLLGIALAGSLALPQAYAEGRWYKGNTHAHSTQSDGNRPPETVARWYHDNGYNFLVLSEHNKLLDPASVRMPRDPRPDFILIPGEEVTGGAHVHFTGFNLGALADWRAEGEKPERIQRLADGILQAEGIPILNHPNYHWTIATEDLLPVERLHFFELYNGHPEANNQGGRGRPSTEALWDKLLSNGKAMYAVASDDAHHYDKRDAKINNPGRGWIMVRAEALTPAKIAQAMLQGDFYASTGVVLKDLSTQDGAYRVAVDEAETQKQLSSKWLIGRKLSKGEAGYTIEFIGPGRRVLQRTSGPEASFPLTNEHAYVRCRVQFVKKSGKKLTAYEAWTQPVWRAR